MGTTNGKHIRFFFSLVVKPLPRKNFEGQDLNEKNFQSRLSEDGGNDGVVDTASSGSTDDAEIAALTPRGVPGVLDDPVGSAGASISAVADDQKSVIEGGGVAIVSAGGVDDTAGVIHEQVSVQSNGEGTSVDEEGGHESGLISSVGDGQASVVLEGSEVGSGHLASSVLTSVRISVLGLESTPGHNVGHGVPHPSTLASRVADLLSLLHAASVRAIDDHLLRELLGSGLVVLDGVGRLEATSGGESPA